ncbi:MAG: substrate-binding domain-containing protein, partial [Longicatena sp.]
FCCNDLMAIGVLNACKEVGVSVPDEFSIIGFDNIILSKLVEPKLTTIDQNMYELGNQAAKLILETIKEEQSISKKVVLNATFVPRETLAEKKG